MAKKSLDFYQIYYREDQVKELYSFARGYYNQHLTSYFENSIISDLVPASNADLIAVCSWRLRRKRGDSSAEIILKRNGTFELTEQRILESDYDVAILTPRSPTHKPLAMARNWHGQAWSDAFMVLKIFLHTHKLAKVPDELTYAIYENHFIAKREIYLSYVSECLIPVIQFMQRERGVFEKDSGYIQKKRNDPEAIKDYQTKSGRVDWPIAPFILERLFSIWINNKGFKVINL